MTRLESLMSRIGESRTVLIDGGTGTECERRGIPVQDGAWSSGGALSHPDIVLGVHHDYIAAGARVIIANTFSTHRHALEAAGVAQDFVAYNRRACELAVQARSEAGVDAVVVAGAISNWTFTGAHPALEVLRRNSAEQAAAMAAGGAELMILEMMIDIDRMRATLDGLRGSLLPVWVGFTCGTPDGRPVSDDGVPRLRDGEPLAEAIATLGDYDVEAIVIMHTDVTLIDDCLEVALQAWPKTVGVYAHSGKFVGGEWLFGDVISPEEYLSYAQVWANLGVPLVGGCCGIGPEHITALNGQLTGPAKRFVPSDSPRPRRHRKRRG